MPIFIIDEIFFSSDKGVDDELQKPTTNQLIRLIRRTFTCLGVGLVLLGTDSRIANMLDTRGDNSESRTTTYP